ncbi:hypothetical protein [Polynucleobacter sp. MWH-Berg-3C6]|uniref:hypothetical protein n=1 Tax=Polynucleobacter sp. MWH-Berg-3C6 TaxID=1855882 RepID=UPI001C0AC946|nr:hypothetical protein [Polynucleobacter sp. MWH-Berg-3C6]MBU3551573.1 hypothetical protein [Polynucleobacter sp. MWH-Berg-3C6]
MKYLVSLGLLLTAGLANAVSYDCAVTKKLDFENVYQPAQMEKYKFSARIHDSDKPKVDRCSIKPNDNKVTCDSYDIDRVEVDKHVGYKKFYLFRSQYDIQLFPDMKFVESNGRGGIAFGACKLL